MRARLGSLLLLSSCLHFERSPQFEARRAKGAARIEAGGCQVDGVRPSPDPKAMTSPKTETSSASSARGSLPRSEIQAAIQDFFPDFKSCYEMALERNPKLEGTLSLRFVIGARGRPVRSTIQNSELKDPKLDSCMVELSCALEFPEPKGGGIVTVTYPFVFSRDW